MDEMMVCEECGCSFPYSERIKRTDADEEDLCPFCKGDFISDARRCRVCGAEKSVTTNAHLLIDGVCNECVDRYVKQYNDALGTLNPDVYEMLCDLFGDLKL